MKIVAGIGSIDDYEAFSEAGASEVFLGYVPAEYYHGHIKGQPLNRREVLYYNVQIGSESELLILSKMQKEFGVQASVTLNSLHYDNVDEVIEYVLKVMKLGIKSFIVADYVLWQRLSKLQGIELILSGEFGEMNHLVLNDFKNAKRIIFPRQTTIDEMQEMIKHAPEDIHEFEAFVLNEKCHFTGAYCNSYHCDELCHMCHLPYKLMKDGEVVRETTLNQEAKEDILGASGCGICALWKLREAGITHLKVVSRGNDSDSTIRDIKELKKALTILESSSSEDEYMKKVKNELFADGCSENCYYIAL